jgi:hypothetical protein
MTEFEVQTAERSSIHDTGTLAPQQMNTGILGPQ